MNENKRVNKFQDFKEHMNKNRELMRLLKLKLEKLKEEKLKK